MAANGPARQAAMLCKDELFWRYLDARTRAKNGLSQHDLPDGTHSEDDARSAICTACGVKSRSQIKDADGGMAMLGRIIRDFSRWKKRNGVQ